MTVDNLVSADVVTANGQLVCASNQCVREGVGRERHHSFEMHAAHLQPGAAEPAPARLDDPKKRWKFREGDLADRLLWDDFMSAYEVALSRCSAEWAPWFVTPSDRNWVRSAAIARIVRDTLLGMKLTYPAPDWDPAQFTIP